MRIAVRGTGMVGQALAGKLAELGHEVVVGPGIRRRRWLAASRTTSATRPSRPLPRARVVKALNTMNCEVMADPAKVPGEHHVFLCGDDADAKRRVSSLLESFGWPPEA